MSGNEYDENLDDLKDSKEDYGEKIEDNNNDQDNEKEFIEELYDKLDDNNINIDFLENIEDKPVDTDKLYDIVAIIPECVRSKKSDTDVIFTDRIEDKSENKDTNKDFLEGIEDKLEGNSNEIDFVKGVEYKLEDQDTNQNLIEDTGNELNISGANENLSENLENQSSEIIKNKQNENERIKLDQNDLKKVWGELRTKGYTLIQISEQIGCDIKGVLYRNYGIKNESLAKLENLIGREIAKVENIPKSEIEYRIQIEPSKLKQVCDNLNSRGISNNQISRKIGTYIGNALYKEYSLDITSFKELEKLYGKEIKHEIKEDKPTERKITEIRINNIEKSNDNSKMTTQEEIIKDIRQNYDSEKDTIEEINNLTKNGDSAEMVCIGLGDGSIPHNKQRFRVTTNKSEEIEYVKDINNLMKKVFNKYPSIYEPKEANAIKQTINGKEIVNELVNLGLKPGDKKVNQVSVPEWIMENKEYQKRGLRGLVDTDGSFHIHKANNCIRIGFKNASYPLMEDFKKMCENNDIKTGKIYPVTRENTYELHIESKKDVVKFINEIKPRKWDYRAKTLGLVLKSRGDPEKRIKIESELSKTYPNRRTYYSKEYRDDLRRLCKKHGYDVSKESIINEIEEILMYKVNAKGYPSKDEKINYNIQAKKIIDDLKAKWKML